MKHIIYIITTTLFISLFSGCGGGSTPANESFNHAPALKLSSNPAIDEIFLQWNRIDGVNNYLLEWGHLNDTLQNSISLDGTQTEYLHQDLEPGTTYYYRITAKFTDEQSHQSSEIIAVRTGNVVQIMQSDKAF